MTKVGCESGLIKSLIEDEKIRFSPVTFRSPQSTDLVQVQFLGKRVFGYPGIVHGGLIATLFDKTFVKCVMPSLPSGVGVTASLSVSFKSPCHADRLTVIHAKVERVERRKVWVQGRLEEVGDDGLRSVVAEAEVLIIEPRQSEVMIPNNISSADCSTHSLL